MDQLEVGNVLVVGAGMAGIRSALDLAETGYHVYLSESSPAIGGILAKLDYQFPTDHCGMCRMLPFVGRESSSEFCMRKSLFHDNITILPNNEVIACEGEPGKFQVTLRQKAQRVNTDVCIGDGECAVVCPIEVDDAFNEGLTKRKAIYRPVPHNLPNIWTIDTEACDRCGECVKACPVGAINLDAEDTEQTLTVGAVVLAAGAGIFTPVTEPNFYAYGQCPNVLTSLEFERIMSGTGTYKGGPILRPHDGKEAKKIAWIQCVGSRNRRLNREYCSSICCMFSLKEAALAKERSGPDSDLAIFYMDMRTFGKDYYRYRNKVEHEMGVRFVRARPQAVVANSGGEPMIRYFDASGKACEETFDLVILATGQTPPAEISSLKSVFGFDVNQHGFAKPAGDRGMETTAPGVFACGSFMGLTDISEALIQGSAAASEVSTLMKNSGLGKIEEAASSVEERLVDRVAPQVAVVFCRCSSTSQVQSFDLDSFADQVKALYHVASVHIVKDACGADQAELREELQKSPANRVLFAACLPFVHKRRLRDVAKQEGFNPSLVEVIDFQSQIKRAKAANAKPQEAGALTLINTVVQSLATADVVRATRVSVEKRALVIGGGIAGMRGALTLANQGVAVTLIEKENELGGHARNLHLQLAGPDPKATVEELSAAVSENPIIDLLTGAEVIATTGSAGKFHSTVTKFDGTSVIIKHGATILATGAHEAPAGDKYAYGQSDAIMTQEEMETALAEGKLGADDLGTVVMIQCVGSREIGEREYCSRLCCASALKNARRILEIGPKARVIILYRDMMTYGFKEQFFSEAREKGVIFSTYSLDAKPTVTVEEDKLMVTFKDEVLGRDVTVHPGHVVLSTGVEPANQSKLAEIFKVELDDHGFFHEADYKFRPVEMIRQGIFVCGLAHSPRSIPEALETAEAAAQRALSVLARDELRSAKLTSRVRKAVCAVCEICVNVCPYQARSVDKVDDCIIVDPIACQGCGICVAACPSNAAVLTGKMEERIMVNLDAQLASL
jgi:heterodisulfide reductase subunit A2